MSGGLRAIVVGAGIGGLATAIGLDRAGVEPEVYEQAPALEEVGAGLTLWANAMAALGDLGLDGAVAGAGREDIVGVIRSWRGEILARTDAGALAAALGGPSVVIHRADLQAVLLEALEARRLSAQRAVSLGARVVRVDQDWHGVTARLADGRTVRADLLVGADGLYSTVRRMVLDDDAPRYAGQRAWRGVAPFDREVQGGESWGCGLRFGLVQLAPGRVYWYAVANAPEGQQDDEPLARFGAWHDPIPALLAATPPEAIHRGDTYDRVPARRWGTARVTLVGDAAHPMTPNLGQGACQAIEDAAVLARVLSQPGVRADVPAALRRYERHRRRRTATIMRLSRWIGAVAQSEHRVACRVRDGVLRAMPPGVQVRQLQRIASARAFRATLP